MGVKLLIAKFYGLNSKQIKVYIYSSLTIQKGFSAPNDYTSNLHGETGGYIQPKIQYTLPIKMVNSTV